MPFEEWADHHVLFPYPNLSYPTTVHRLYLAEGFLGEISDGVDRLEKDLAAWRKILASARTVVTKVIALEEYFYDQPEKMDSLWWSKLVELGERKAEGR